METTPLKFKKVILPAATLRALKPGTSIKIETEIVKTSILRSAASKLKQEGYLFRVSDKGPVNERVTREE